MGERALEVLARDHRGPDQAPHPPVDVVQREHVERVHHAHRDGVPLLPDGNGLEAPREVLREEQHRRLVGDHLAQIDVLQSELERERLTDPALRGKPHLHEHLAQAPVPAPAFLLAERIGELLERDHPRLHEDLPEPAPARADRGTPSRLRGRGRLHQLVVHRACGHRYLPSRARPAATGSAPVSVSCA